MFVYLPVAEMSVAAESILLLGGVVGFLSGVFGVGGGFLTTPFLIFLGIPPAVAVGTQASQLVASSVTGVLGHWHKKNVDLKIGVVMLIGSAGGTLIGIGIFRLLQHIGQIDLAISLLYVFLLGAVGSMMLLESTKSLLNRNKSRKDFKPLYQRPFLRNLPYPVKFPKSRLYISVLLPGGIGFVGGLLVAIMGIGGGFLLVPAMIYILGMPSLLVSGTSLFQVMVTTFFATIMHSVASETVDLVLGLMLIIGGVVGAQLGIRVSTHIRGANARFLLAFLVLAVSIALAAELFLEPSDLYTLQKR